MTPGDGVTSAVTSLPSHTLPEDGSIRGLVADVPDHVIVLQALALFLLWTSALLGNALVCLVIYRSRRVQSTTNYFVVSIACSDISLVLLTAPFVCARVLRQQWEVGHVLCRLARFVQFASTACTSFVLVAICADRFYTVLYPLSFKVTRGTAKRLVIGAWLLATMSSILCMYFFNLEVVEDVRGSGNRRVCPTFVPSRSWAGVVYACVCIVTHYLAPAAFVVIGYSRIACYIRDSRSRARCSHAQSNPVPRTKVKMVKMLALLTGVSFLLHLPLHIAQVVYCFSYRSYLSQNVFITSYWLLVASAALKPVIYACRNSNFWLGCKEVLCMSAMKCYRLNVYAVTNASSVGKRNYIGVMDLSREQVSTTVDSPVCPCGAERYLDKQNWPVHGALPSTSL